MACSASGATDLDGVPSRRNPFTFMKCILGVSLSCQKNDPRGARRGTNLTIEIDNCKYRQLT